MGFKQLEDNRKRKLKVLRLSLKQNCNFSCIYCKPENYSLDVLNIEQFKKQYTWKTFAKKIMELV